MRLDFSDLTKLPGEEQVDIIAWGTQVRKNMFSAVKGYFENRRVVVGGQVGQKTQPFKKKISNE